MKRRSRLSRAKGYLHKMDVRITENIELERLLGALRVRAEGGSWKDVGIHFGYADRQYLGTPHPVSPEKAKAEVNALYNKHLHGRKTFILMSTRFGKIAGRKRYDMKRLLK